MTTVAFNERTHDSGKRNANANDGQGSDQHELPRPATEEVPEVERHPHVDPAEEAMGHNPNLSPPITIHPEPKAL